MSDLIQWPTAKWWEKQWNPIIGCRPCSPACENCYAAAWARRFGQSFEPHESSQVRPPRRGVVFCGNMTDLFGEWTDCEIIGQYIWRNHLGAMHDSNAVYLWLTKRVDRMVEAIRYAETRTYWPSCDFQSLYSNHYFGFTAENQEWYENRMNYCAQHFPAWANLWISAEPLLGEIDMCLYHYWILPKWVVVGCESGPNRRPCKVEWIESIVDQCRTAGVPVFVKQLDIGGKCVTDISKFPEHLRIRQVPWAEKGKHK